MRSIEPVHHGRSHFPYSHPARALGHLELPPTDWNTNATIATRHRVLSTQDIVDEDLYDMMECSTWALCFSRRIDRSDKCDGQGAGVALAHAIARFPDHVIQLTGPAYY